MSIIILCVCYWYYGLPKIMQQRYVFKDSHDLCDDLVGC